LINTKPNSSPVEHPFIIQPDTPHHIYVKQHSPNIGHHKLDHPLSNVSIDNHLLPNHTLSNGSIDNHLLPDHPLSNVSIDNHLIPDQPMSNGKLFNHLFMHDPIHD